MATQSKKLKTSVSAILLSNYFQNNTHDETDQDNSQYHDNTRDDLNNEVESDDAEPDLARDYFSFSERSKHRINKIITDKLLAIEQWANEKYGLCLHTVKFTTANVTKNIDKRSQRKFKLEITNKDAADQCSSLIALRVNRYSLKNESFWSIFLFVIFYFLRQKKQIC
jgi:hypothetical protein